MRLIKQSEQAFYHHRCIGLYLKLYLQITKCFCSRIYFEYIVWHLLITNKGICFENSLNSSFSDLVFLLHLFRVKILEFINPFHATDLLLYPLTYQKTGRFLTFSRGIETSGIKQVNLELYSVLQYGADSPQVKRNLISCITSLV